MYIIKNVITGIVPGSKYQKYLPITLVCKSYSKLLDVNVKTSQTGLKLDVSYVEEDEFTISGVYNKKILFIVKKPGENLEAEYVFFKLHEVIICDKVEKFYIFYKEECPSDEDRDNKLNKILD